MTDTADEAREVIQEQRKHMLEINMKWLYRLADWLFPYPQEYWYRIKIHKMKKNNEAKKQRKASKDKT